MNGQGCRMEKGGPSDLPAEQRLWKEKGKETGLEGRASLCDAGQNIQASSKEALE